MSKTRFIIAGNFIDGRSNDVHRKVFLAIKGTTITAVGPVSDLPCNDKSATVDFSHCTIVPALVDCSLSLSHSPSVDIDIRSASQKADLSQKITMLEQHIEYCHTHGVLGVADNDNIRHLLSHCLTIKMNEKLIDLRIPHRICQKIQNQTNSNPASGDFIKIFPSGNIEEGYTLQHSWLNPKILHQILMHKDGRKTVVVANGPEQVKDAIDAGCDAVEQGYRMGEDNLKKMAEKSILWIPNVLLAKNGLDSAGSGGDIGCRFSQRYVASGKQSPTAEAFWYKMLSSQMIQLRLARELGVTTAIGTGAGTTGILHGESMVEEMKLFIKAGYTLEETIHCASDNGARFFNMKDMGSITVGKTATFLVTRGTAKQLPRKLSYLESIYINGQPSPIYQKNPFRTT